MKNISIDLDRPQIRLLSRDKIERIHQASLELLSRTGVKVLLPEAVELMADAGCEVIDSDLVKIPSRLVEECLDAAPSSITVFDRNGQPALQLEGQNIHFGTGPTIQYVLDVETGQRRDTTMDDIAKAARIVDYLPNLDYAMTMGMSGGVDPRSHDLDPVVTDRFDFAAMLLNTTKPLMFSNWSVEGLSDCYEMAVTVRGGSESNFRKSPFIMVYCEPTTPLLHDRDPLALALFCAEKSIPLLNVSGPVAGGTAPVTLAACLVLSNAEMLSGLVIAQLKNKGAPVIYGGGASPLDMRTSVNLYGGPQFCLDHIALKELANFYNLPDFNTGGCTDAKTLDQHAAIDYTMSLVQSALVGSNLIHDVGYLESGYTACWEGIVMADEIIDYLKNFLKGIPVDEESMALDLIHKQGPGGSFMAEEHTFDHFRSVWYPELMNRDSHANWTKAGSKDLKTKLTEKVQDILANHRPEPLDEQIVRTVEGILERAKQRHPVKDRAAGPRR